jgi:S-adenosylmethionine:tRNA-ribosyltransferase-isomerase (queuine synthetase)
VRLSDFDYNLPPELIAEEPLAKRSDSRLLVLDKQNGAITHLHFRDLPSKLTEKDLLILNNTKVIPARLYAHKPTGGAVEILIERMLPNNKVLAQTKACKSLKINEKLIIGDNIWFEIIGRQDNLFELVLCSPWPLETILQRFGKVPLPPYIKHAPTMDDQKNYQTIYAKEPGAVAAPTAGLHFDQDLIAALTKKGSKMPLLPYMLA